MGLGKMMTRSQDLNIAITDQHDNLAETLVIHGGITPSWVATPYAGMQIPGAWRASTLLADLLGQIPWDAYRSIGGGPADKIEPRPSLLEDPTAGEYTRAEAFAAWMLDLIWNGNACGLVAARNAQGYPTAIYPIPAEMVGVRRVPPGNGTNLPIGSIEYQVGSLSGLSKYDMFHVKGHHRPSDVRGMGVLEAHLATLQTAKAQQEQAESTARHGVPTGVLVTTSEDTTRGDMKKAKQSWMASQRAATIAALGPGTDFKPIAWNPDQMQMVQGRKFTLGELELIFGMPAGWLGGDAPSMRYANLEQDAINLIKFGLAGHITRFEQTLSQMFPRGTDVKGLLDVILRSDTMSRYQAYALGIDKGFLTVPEVREKENLPPLPLDGELLPPDPAGQPPAIDNIADAELVDEQPAINPLDEVN